MPDLYRDVVPPPAGDPVTAAVPPAADAGHPAPVPSAAPDSRMMLRFAALVLGLTGIWQAAAGLAALTSSSSDRTPVARLPAHVGYATWGWVHLVVGVVAVVCAFAVLSGNRLAAVVAVALAVLSAAVNLLFLKAQPAASLVVIALDVVVIWGVTSRAEGPRPPR